MNRMPLINTVAKLPESFGTSGNRKPWRSSLPSHMKLLTVFFLIFSPLAVTHVAQASGAETTLNSKLLGQFLQKHCFRCHGAEEQNGSARFDTLDYAISNKIEALHYQDVLDVLNGGDMPPEDEPQPSNAELEVVIGELTVRLFEARKRLASNGSTPPQFVTCSASNRPDRGFLQTTMWSTSTPWEAASFLRRRISMNTTSWRRKCCGKASNGLGCVRLSKPGWSSPKTTGPTVFARISSVGKGRPARSCGSLRCERSISHGPWWKVVSTSMNPYGTSVSDRQLILAVVTGFESRPALKEKWRHFDDS